MVEERVNGALESRRIDEEKAAEILVDAEERAEAIVSGEFEPRKRGFGRRGPEGPGSAPGSTGAGA